MKATSKPRVSSTKYRFAKIRFPFGTPTYELESTSGLKVGDQVRVFSTITEKFIHSLGMDKLVRNGHKQTWIHPGSVVETDRVIVAIKGHNVTLDAAFPDSIRPQFFDSDSDIPYLSTYTWESRIQHSAVENFMVVHPSGGGENIDGFLLIDDAINCWTRDIVIKDFDKHVVGTGVGAKFITIQRLYVIFTVQHESYAPPGILDMQGTQILHRDSIITGGGKFWPLTAATTRSRGPTVHYNIQIDSGAGANVVPHMRWATGVLYDNIVNKKGTIQIYDRGDDGTGHGWTMGWGVIWNGVALQLCAQNPLDMSDSSMPVLYHNWLVGGKGENVPGKLTTKLIGTYDYPGKGIVFPYSLYEAQVKDKELRSNK